MNDQPLVLVIGGINGAGKTTSARTMLPRFKQIAQFVNADEIARGISPFAPESVAFQAGKVTLDRIRDLRRLRLSFAFESTLSGRSYAAILREMIAENYSVELFYLWLPSADLAIRRVANRVALGGHHIPPDMIRMRYLLSLQNAVKLYIPMADRWTLCDNSRDAPRIFASGGTHLETRAHIPEIYNAFIRQGSKKTTDDAAEETG